MTPTPGVGHDYIQSLSETVNPANGSVSIRIAAPTPQERGLNLPIYAYANDTNGTYQWTPIFISGGSSQYKTLLNEINPISGLGPTGGSTLTGGTQGSGSPGTLSKTVITLESGVSHTCEYTTDYVYTDNAGGRHPLGLLFMEPPYNNANSCGFFGVSYGSFSSGGDDTIKATLDPASLLGDVFIYDLHGNQLNPDYHVEDTNGNYLNGTGRQYSATYVGGASSTLATLTIPGLAKPAGQAAPFTYTYEPGNGIAPPSPFSPNAVGAPSNDPLCPKSFVAAPKPTSSAGNTVIQLPNGQAYTIASDTNYGLVSKITYPTGATVSYTWANNPQSDSITYQEPGSDSCSYTFDMPAIKTRIVSYDGVHPALEQDFAYTTNRSSGPFKTTTVTTKDLIRPGTPTFQTIYNYSVGNPYFQPNTVVQLGSSIPVEHTITYKDTSGNVLRTVTKAWANTDQLTAECTTLPNGQTSGVFYQYELFTTLVTDRAEYDYGLVSTPCAQPSSTPTRETVTAYQSFATTAIHTNILDRPSSVVIKDHGTVVAQTNYSYDQNAIAGVTPAAIAHDETLYASGSTTPRGNLTGVSQVCLQSCTSPTTKYSYDETGQLTAVLDPCGNTACGDMTGAIHTTTYSYADNYSSAYGTPAGNTNTYVTSATIPAANGVAHTDKYQYGFDNGKMTSHTDQNGNVTTYCYETSGCSGLLEPWARLSQVTNPDGGKTTVTYSDAGPNPTTITSVAMSSSATKTNESIFDAYGHVLHVKLTSDPEGTDTADTTYDGLGLPYTVSNPYRSTSDSTYGLTTYTYDALGRTLNQLQPDSSSLKWSYSSNVTTFTDEALHSWARTSDAFGRLINVTEPDGAATGYSYNALNDLLTVTQNGLSGETPRLPRSFVYDSLSRLTSASNPETGIIGYVYDANGNVTKKTDARSIAMNYSYDELNRLIGKVASDGSINYSYAYDGTGQGASVGRLTHSSNDVNAAHFLIYDVMGRVNQETYCIPSDCSYATSFHATYDLAGNVTSLTYPDGRAVNQTWDGGGHLTQVSDSSNGNIYLTSSSTYWPTGAPSAIFYGNGVGNGYDENNRLQINEIGLVRVGSSAPGNYTGNNNLSVKEYCYGPATSALSPSIPGCPSLAVANNGNIGQITDILNSADTQNFSYDSLNRISTFKIAGATNQTFQIDSFGNMTQSGTLNSGLTFLTNNNRTNTPGYVYDAAGDLTSSNNGVVNTYGYDAESKLVNVNNGVATYTYDADGNRVRKNSSGTWTEYVSFAGQILAEKSTDGTWSDYIFANGQRIARAENYDIRIHMSGTNCTGCGSTNTFAGTQSLTAANGTVVQTGDLLTWRQYQDGVAAGGISVAFNNNTVGTAGVLRAADGQLADADTRTGNWYMRVADLSAYIGMSVSNLNLYNYQGGAPGNWDIYLGDISLVHPNGTVVPIYSRALSTLTPFQGAAESNVTVITEKAIGVNAIDTTYYSGDQIGSTSLLTDYAGWPISSELYYPFGAEPTPPSNSNHYKFTGKERDAESGLDYFGARYFGSTMGRFMSPDGPFNDQSPDNPQSWNLYSYGRNNPLIGTDPDGTTYNVCDSNGQNCSNIDDKTFEANQKSDQQNGVQYSNGTISQHDDNGNLVKSGTYSHDPDIAGDPASNIAAMGNIGNQGMSAIKVFVAGSVVGGTIGGVGLATGVIGGETGASLAGVGRSGASVANKLLHIFGNPEHGLGPLVQKLGGPLAAYEAIQQAAQEQVQANGTNGVFKDVAVTVGGQVIEVSGRIISGVVNIGTASGNLRH